MSGRKRSKNGDDNLDLPPPKRQRQRYIDRHLQVTACDPHGPGPSGNQTRHCHHADSPEGPKRLATPCMMPGRPSHDTHWRGDRSSREGRKGKGKKRNEHNSTHGTKRFKTASVPHSNIDFSIPEKLEDLLKAAIGHQVSSLINNPYLVVYLNSSSLDFTSVSLMMNLLDNAISCKHEVLRKRVQCVVLPKILENRGFLEAVRYHLCSLPGNARDQDRKISLSFVEQICKLFELILLSGNVLASAILPVDALWGTTRQLTTQKQLLFEPLHDKAKEILEIRDKMRQTRHDISKKRRIENDEIVLPTRKELEQKTLPTDLPSNNLDRPYPNAHQYLCTQYRLLREDFIHPLRCAFHDIESDEEEYQSLKVYHDVTIKSAAYSSYDCTTFEISFQAPKLNNCIDWERTKRLKYGDLVCLMNSSMFLFATVAERNVEDLRSGIITVDFRTKVDVMELPSMTYCMIESPGFYAAYAPILHLLHDLQEDPESLPFSRYIVELKKDIHPPKYIANGGVYRLNLHSVICGKEQHQCEHPPCKEVNVMDEEVWKNLPTPELDNSQKQALHAALTRELSIIQGPPGTGKTYIGLKIVETLLQNRASWDKGHGRSKIVVVCYTNHALDQFLEGIIKKIGHIIDKDTQIRRVGGRSGGRSKSTLVQEYNINTFVRNHLRTLGIFGFWRNKNRKMVQQIDALTSLLEHAFQPKKIKLYASFIGDSIRMMMEMNNVEIPFLTTKSSKEVAEWLGLSPCEIHSDCNSYNDTAEADRKIAGNDDDDEENNIIEEFGTEQLCHFFKDLARVEPLTEERAIKVSQDEDIESYVRLQLFKYYLQNVKEKLKEELRMGKEREEWYEDQRKMAMISCLQHADIVGLTTTGAAIHNNLLSQMNAKVVIIEEAAEVLEAHTVSSLSKHTQHLILIGDHQQLRPRTNAHILARDYRLDVSLFERLVRNEFPYVTLQVQHRMRPEISALVSSHIYNNALINAPPTKDYRHVFGMEHDIFFFDHNEKEVSDNDLTSKANKFEASFLAQLCNYLLQQRTYSQEQITVLTPYTGQMFKIRERFQENNMPNVRIVPIDSYQGEENEIILISLVRSEIPGFVKDENRICVALSRAKQGLYVVGNFSKLFVHKSKLWRSLVRDMDAKGKFGTSLPLVCQGHSTPTKVKTTGDFNLVRNGGCSLPCNSRLPCMHMCPHQCHPDPDNTVHATIVCKEPCPRYCPQGREQGHRCKKMCRDCKIICDPCEVEVEKIIPKCGHTQQVPCYRDPKNFICQEPCTKILPCNHKCKNTCGEPHIVECQELVTKECLNKHEGKAECYLTKEGFSRRCNALCGEALMCGHTCRGTCGECRQGRLHKPCTMDCDRTLTCGHICTSKCAQNCPPCKKQCLVTCPHGPCGHDCHQQCRPCPHDCERKCEHQHCTCLCGELCDCTPCDQPCTKVLPCTHECMGLCGEKCPDVCRICNKDTFNDKVPMIFGTEDVESPELRIIMLDCEHMFDVKKMDEWMQSKVTGKIQWKCCLLCKQPIFKTNRYREFVIKFITDLNDVKEMNCVMSPKEHRHYQSKVKEMVRRSSLIQNRGKVAQQIERVSGQRLQAEYIIFYAEQSVEKSIKDTATEMDTTDAMHAGNLPRKNQADLGAAMATLKNQKQDLIHKLQFYRRQNITEQVLHDVQAEQHRIELLSAVLKVQSQIGAKNIKITSADQEKLDEFLSTYEVRGDRVCKVKMSPSEYESSMMYIEDLRKRHPDITGITHEEKEMIIRTIGAKPGSWYKCPKGHIYNIGECGGAMEEGTCPECKSTIGGGRHRLRSDNAHAREFDRSSHAAWPMGDDMANYDLHNIH